MERLKRYSKQIMAFVSALVVLVGGVFSTSFHSLASDTMVGSSNPSYYLPYPEPDTSENNGYMVVVDKYGSTNTYFWSFHVSNSPSESISADIRTYCTSHTDLNHWSIGAWGHSDSDTSIAYDMYKYDSKGRITLVGHTLNQSTCIFPGNDIIGVKVGGNAYMSSIGTFSHNFNVYFDSSGSSALLYDIIQKLNTSNSYDSSMADTLNRILNQCNTANEQLTKVTSYLSSIKSLLTDIETDIDVLLEKYDELIAEEKKQTSWLEKIWNSLQEFLGLQGGESTEDLEGKEESAELEKQEDELLNDDSMNTDDLELELNTNASGSIWTMVDNLVRSHEKLFTTLISILTLGIVALILNR